MIGGALVAEGACDRLVHGETGVVREGEAELGQRLRPFVAAMGHRAQIGDGEVAAAVGGVGGRGDGRRIGRPHGGGGEGRGTQARRLLDRGAERRKPVPVRAPVRGQDALGEAEA